MIIDGGIGSVKCAIEYSNNKMHVIGPKKAFFGYKLGSASATNGIFAEWNIENDSLILTNDKFGFYPIFYFKNENSFAFSSSIFELSDMDNSYQLDDAAIAVFLRMGSFIGDTTPFKNIKALPPGATLQFNKGYFSLQSDKIMFGKEQISFLKEAQVNYGELFQKSIENFCDVNAKKIGIPLSGGRDSRHILFAILRSGMKPFSCITMKHQPHKPDEDAEIAREVCTSLALDHVILEQPLSFLNAEIEKNITTNFCSLEHSWILPLSKYLFKERYDVIFDGIGGDVLSAGLFLTKQRLDLYRREKFEELSNELLGDEGYLPKMLTKSAYKRFGRDIAIELLSRELKLHANAPNPVGEFFFWNRTRRLITMSSWRILSKNCQVYAPYLDHKLYEFLSSLPAEYFLDHKFHQDTINSYYPEYSHLRYETKKVPPKKISHFSNFYRLFELMIYFVPEFKGQSMYRSLFIYPRIIKGILSPKFYSHTVDMYKISIYLRELSKYI